MLTAEQIGVLRDSAEKLLDPITEYLLDDIAKRVAAAGQFTGTASYQVWRLQELGLSQRQIKKEIAKRLKISLKNTEKLLTQVAKTGYNFDMSRFPTKHGIPFSANSSLQQILQATIQLAKEDLTNVSQTIGFVGPDGKCRKLTDAYNQACDFAFQKASTGGQDYWSAIREATKNLADQGIRVIDYESGVHTSLEAAVRRNIMGGAGLMQEQISQLNHDELGCDGWEISAHAASAPDHEPYQGKQYTDAEYYSLNNSLVRRIGTLNCGHSASPIILGVNDPQYTAEELEQFRKENEEGITIGGKHYTLYEATQRQRKYERKIRKQRHKILVAEGLNDKEQLQTAQIKMVRLQEEYVRFSKDAKLPLQHARMEVSGFNWKHATAAERAKETADKQSLYSGAINSEKPKPSRLITDFAKHTLAVWDNSIGSQSWTDEKQKALYSAEIVTTRLKHERATLFSQQGELILEKSGDANSVHFTSKEIRMMRNAVLTHNHPDSSCFSYQDINMLRVGKLSEIRAATKDGVYRIQAPKIWNEEILTLEKLEKTYYDIDRQISPDFYRRAHAGEFSLWDAEMLGQKATISELCSRYGIPFLFDSWEVLT